MTSFPLHQRWRAGNLLGKGMHASATALRRPGSGIRPEILAPGVGFTHVGQGRISLHVIVVRQQEDPDLVPVSSPRVGRWLSNDPIGISGGLNQYTAFGNNPVMVVDPWGEKSRLRMWGEQRLGYIAGLHEGFRESLVRQGQALVGFYADVLRGNWGDLGRWHDDTALGQADEVCGLVRTITYGGLIVSSASVVTLAGIGTGYGAYQYLSPQVSRYAAIATLNTVIHIGSGFTQGRPLPKAILTNHRLPQTIERLVDTMR